MIYVLEERGDVGSRDRSVLAGGRSSLDILSERKPLIERFAKWCSGVGASYLAISEDVSPAAQPCVNRVRYRINERLVVSTLRRPQIVPRPRQSVCLGDSSLASGTGA